MSAQVVRSPSIVLFNGKPAVEVGNEAIVITVLMGGGHIASVRVPGSDINPLWVPDWPTTTPGMRRILARNFSQAEENRLESELLACIGGHNLCCDVFGSHSSGEVAAGASFHGEAGLTTWEVTGLDETTGALTMRAHLPRTQMTVERIFTPDANNEPSMNVVERITNLLQTERAIGRSQHVTLGKQILDKSSGACSFDCNGDKGLTWPTVADKSSTFECNKEFEYPKIPMSTRSSTDKEFCDWRKYPRVEANSDLCTLRINPADNHGWFSCTKDLTSSNLDDDMAAISGKSLVLVYKWERKVFPWLMSWEENYAREAKPWSGRTLTRGLEFGSYAMALGRRWNVEQGKLFDTFCYEWIDANETKETTFTIAMKHCFDGDEAAGFKEKVIGGK